MTSSPGVRDVAGGEEPVVCETSRGNMYVTVVGIDRYRAWSSLQRAVSDARGARDAFVKLGFKEFRPALFDDAATGAALQRLVTDELRALGNEDSLVVFFAGHGHTVTTPYPDHTVSKRGYLVPVDAEPPGTTSVGTLVSLDNWLHDLAHLPPKHILVVIDACHSGIALNPVIRWRGEDIRTSEPLARLRARRSRRIITSALDNELAMDGGPIEGHSLFTGCLIEALTGGLQAKTGQRTVTGSEIALHVQRRVSSFPASRQTPDFGALELDNRGELVIDLGRSEPAETAQHHGVDTILPVKTGTRRPGSSGGFSEPARSGVDSIQPRRAKTDPALAALAPDKVHSAAPAMETQRAPAVVSPAPSSPIQPPGNAGDPRSAAPAGLGQGAPVTGSASETATSPGIQATGSSATAQDERPRSSDRAPTRLSPAEMAFATALDRHHAARQRGTRVLSLVTADPMTGMTGWASWAAARGSLTLVTEATGLGAATASLLGQMPWLRILCAARRRLAEVASLDLAAVDAALDVRSPSDREAWIDEVAGHDVHARVAGWLLSMVREPWGRVPDLGAAPVQGSDLLAALCDIAAPIAILLHHAEPTAAWLERAIETAAELVESLPGRAIAVNAPGELAASVLRGRFESRAMALARQGEVPLAARAPRAPDPARRRAAQALHAALSKDPRTAGLFEPAVQVPTHDRDRTVVVDLIARDALLAVEIDDWYLFRDPQAYARGRAKDIWLERAQFFVMRFLVEDVDERIGQTMDEIAIALAGRRASGSFVEDAK